MNWKKKHVDMCQKIGVPFDYKKPFGTVVDYFEKSAEMFPMRKIIMATGKLDASITYKEILWQIYALSTGLKKIMKDREIKHVAIHLPSIPQHIIATMAIRHAGMVDVPIDPKWDHGKANYIKERLNEADVSFVITTDYMVKTYLSIRNDMKHKPKIMATHLSDSYPSFLRPIIMAKLKKVKRWANIKDFRKRFRGIVFDWERTIYGNWQNEKNRSEARSSNKSTLIFGSGTSGKQKIICWKHRALSEHAAITLNYNTHPKLDPLSLEYGKETLLSLIPFSHSFGNTVCINVGLALGANLVLVPKPVKPIIKDGKEILIFDPEVVIKIMGKYRPTIVPFAPKIFISILDHIEKIGHKPDFSFVKKFISGSAKLPEEIYKRWLETFGVPIYEGYGLTETCTAGNVNHHLHNKIGTVGMPPPGVEQITIDKKGNEVFGKEGEVLIKGDFLFSEYYNNPKETEKVFWRNNHGVPWLKTGDLGIISKNDLALKIVGRKKYTIIPKSSGKNVSPETVEAIISTHQLVDDVAVIGVSTEKHEEEVGAVISLRENPEISPNELKNSIGKMCLRKLGEPIEVPTIMKFTNQAELERIGALTGTGKIKKEVIKKYFFNQ